MLQYYGVTKLNIYEFFIERSSTSSLVFEGSAVVGTTTNPSKLIFDYDRLTVEDPHWLYTEQQILDCVKKDMWIWSMGFPICPNKFLFNCVIVSV